jgi:ParB-like chromosome segregation protein Spo0J
LPVYLLFTVNYLAKLMPAINPAFKHLIPPPSAEELARLEASLLEEGCREPLIIWDCGLTPENGVLVDGHNRYAICEANGIDYRLTFRRWPDENAVKLWIINNQLGRRNLSDFVKGELALQSKAIVADIAKQNQKLRVKTDGNGGLTNWSDIPDEAAAVNTREKLADIARIGQGSIQRIEKILEKGIPELIETVRAGDLSINAAYKIAENPPESQADIMRGILEGASPSQIPQPKKRNLDDPDDNGDYSTYSEFNCEQMKLEFEVTLLRLGCPQPAASNWASALLETLRRANQGTSVYFSVETSEEHAAKKAAFRAEYNGENRAILCEKYKVSKRTGFRYISGISADFSGKANEKIGD